MNMTKLMVILIILTLIFSLSNSAYAQKEPNEELRDFSVTKEVQEEVRQEQLAETKPPLTFGLKIFLEFINKKAYAKTLSKDEERQLLREKWKELLKIDIFYPYFLKRDIETWVSEKTTIDFFNLKGKAKFEDNQIKYIFKMKF